jgi:cell division protein FtsA
MIKYRIGALDIGTEKTSAAIAEIHDPDQIVIVGTGCTDSSGVIRGSICDLEQASASASQAVKQAEKAAGILMPPVFLTVTGAHIRSEEGYADILISGDPPDIKSSDIDLLIQKVRSLPVDPAEDMIHLITNEFALDGVGNVHHPLGMAARRVEVKACRIFVQHAPLQNLLRSVDGAQIEVAGLVVQALAAGEAVLTEDEKEDGVLLLNLGDGTTDLALYAQGTVHHTATVPIGGHYFTRDIALGLQISHEQAANVKKEHGTLARAVTETPPPIYLPVLAGQETRRISLSTVTDILDARMQELCSRLKRDLSRVDMTEFYPKQMVITGGGSKLPGMKEYLTKEFRLPTRLAQPLMLDVLPASLHAPEFSVMAGLLRYGARQSHTVPSASGMQMSKEKRSGNILSGIQRNWQDFFRQIRNMQ